jgi:hypothetical protein
MALRGEQRREAGGGNRHLRLFGHAVLHLGELLCWLLGIGGMSFSRAAVNHASTSFITRHPSGDALQLIAYRSLPHGSSQCKSSNKLLDYQSGVESPNRTQRR